MVYAACLGARSSSGRRFHVTICTIAPSPSGKAPDSDSGIRWFDPSGAAIFGAKPAFHPGPPQGRFCFPAWCAMRQSASRPGVRRWSPLPRPRHPLERLDDPAHAGAMRCCSPMRWSRWPVWRSGISMACARLGRPAAGRAPQGWRALPPPPPARSSSKAARCARSRTGCHWQPVDTTPCTGMDRWFAPLEPALVARLRQAGARHRRWPAAGERMPTWRAGMSRATGSASTPPTAWAARRRKARIATAWISSRWCCWPPPHQGGEPGCSAPTARRAALHPGAPWSLMLMDDARVIHESTPIQPVDAGAAIATPGADVPGRGSSATTHEARGCDCRGYRYNCN